MKFVLYNEGILMGFLSKSSFSVHERVNSIKSNALNFRRRLMHRKTIGKLTNAFKFRNALAGKSIIDDKFGFNFNIETQWILP
jgi:hypothetical protein